MATGLLSLAPAPHPRRTAVVARVELAQPSYGAGFAATARPL